MKYPGVTRKTFQVLNFIPAQFHWWFVMNCVRNVTCLQDVHFFVRLNVVNMDTQLVPS
jgi:hypothetical protein